MNFEGLAPLPNFKKQRLPFDFFGLPSPHLWQPLGRTLTKKADEEAARKPQAR